MLLDFHLQNKSQEEDSFESIPCPVIPQSPIKMKRRNQEQTLDNLERQNVLFHKFKILLQNDPELVDIYLRYIGNYTKVYIVTEKFLLDMHDIKCLNEICPSPLKDINGSESGGVQGPTDASQRENNDTSTSFGAKTILGKSLALPSQIPCHAHHVTHLPHWPAMPISHLKYIKFNNIFHISTFIIYIYLLVLS